MNPSPLLQTNRSAPVLLFAREDKKQITVYLRNDTDFPFSGTARYLIEQTDGTRRGETAERVTAPPHSETQLLFFDRRELREKKELLRLLLTDEAGLEQSSAYWQSDKLRPRRLCDPKLQTTVFLRAGKVCVTVRAACFAPDVTLSCGDESFSENHFTLFAGEEKTVELQSAKADFAGTVTAHSAYDRR